MNSIKRYATREKINFSPKLCKKFLRDVFLLGVHLKSILFFSSQSVIYKERSTPRLLYTYISAYLKFVIVLFPPLFCMNQPLICSPYVGRTRTSIINVVDRIHHLLYRLVRLRVSTLRRKIWFSLSPSYLSENRVWFTTKCIYSFSFSSLFVQLLLRLIAYRVGFYDNYCYVSKSMLEI